MQQATDHVDELLGLAERRVALRADLVQVDERIEEIRDVLTNGGQKALPPGRQRSLTGRQTGAGQNGESSLTQQVFQLMRKHKSKDWNAVELAEELGMETKQAASSLTALATRDAVEWVSRGRYRVVKK